MTPQPTDPVRDAMPPGPRVRWLLFASACLLLARPASADVLRFLVAELPDRQVHGDSYVLTLSDPDDLARARSLIEDPLQGGHIVVASIAPGFDGINRDHRAPGAPPWSWHVSGFKGFADLTIEILDGWPTFVEQNLEDWIDNTDAMIGFWGYTVVEELGPIPGDADRDGDVDAFDLGIWQTQFSFPAGNLSADFDHDGDVDGFDLGIWQVNFGVAAPGATPVLMPPARAVPSPGLAAILTLGLASLARRGRRAPRRLATRPTPMP